MKKLLLIFVAIAGISTAMFAQFQLLSSKNYPKWGYLGADPQSNGDNKFIANFNSTQATVAYNTYASSSKGMFTMFYTDESPIQNTGKALTINDKKVESWGSTSVNPWRIRNIQALLDSSVVKNTTAYNSGHQFWKAAACIMDVDVAGTDQAWVMYPGMYKRVNFGFQIDLTGGFLTSDVSCDLMTYDMGNTTKAAVYKMIVTIGKDITYPYGTTTIAQLDTLTSLNVAKYRLFSTINIQDMYVVDNVYTTSLVAGDMKKTTLNIASLIGKDKSYFNGKKIYVQFYTTGTPTAIAPGKIDPVVAIDNITGTYTPPRWILPAGIVANTVIDHNNGTPVVDPATLDYTAGTPVNVLADTDTPINIYLTGNYRSSALTITEANDGGAHAPKFSFPATGAIKAKAADGTYSVDVPYTYVAPVGTTKFTLTIAAPAAGTVSMDTLKIALTANVPLNITTTERLEISNGTRFWYDVSAKGVSSLTGVTPEKLDAVKIWGKTKSIVALNAPSDVTVTNIAGQILTIVSPNQASKGIAMQTGIYIVKTGKTIQKVIVE